MQKTTCTRRQFWLSFLFIILVSTFVLMLAYAPPLEKGRTPWHKGGPLIVGAPQPVRQATVISPYGPGFEFELVTRFCAEVSCEPQWMEVSDRDAGIAMLQKGEIDVLVGFWGDLPKDGAHIAAPPAIAVGKPYAHFNPVRIKGATPPQAVDAKDPSPTTLDALARTFSALIPAFLTAPQDLPAEKPPFPVFSLFEDGKGGSSEDILLLDPASYALWRPFLGEIATTQVRGQTPYRWFWRNDASLLSESMENFWKDSKRTQELAELTERYFGFLPKQLRQRDILELSDTLASRLPHYEDFIKKASQETGVPPLLLVAIIYQESRFDPGAISQTNVRGIMQLTSATAAMLKVNRNNPEECILGGARYLRDLKDRIGNKAGNDWDRWFMALAAYNQGMSNLNRTIRLSKELGGKGDNWTDLKRAFPLSTTCRGVEARSFVEKVRYYHFILHGLVALAPPEAQDFAPLLGLAFTEMP